jgi:mannitol/fructose-specific phosphotransferase system IIA component (Ntr-type)
MRSILTALQEGRLFELPEAGKDRALEFLARILDANPDIVVGTDAIEAVKEREEQCNTGIGMGVGIPHVRVKREDGELFCAIGWSKAGIAYGAADGEPVHLVFMYYIPAAQKNVYLKEISSLVKAIKLTGGINPIAHAEDLSIVRNLLLDWVIEVSGESGPEAVARMIKLEVKQAQIPPLPEVPSAGVQSSPASSAVKAMSFATLVLPPQGFMVLSEDPDWTVALEKEPGLAQRLASGNPFLIAGRRVFVVSVTAYAMGRVGYQCVAIPA